MPEAPLPSVAFFIQHTVRNYDEWKKGFDGDQAGRKAAGIFGHHINRGAENPNLVAIYLPAACQAPVDAMFANPRLAEAMKAAGVTSAPSVVVMKPVENHIVGDRATAGSIITAELEDYDAWKKSYDAGAALRTAHGIIGHAVNQVVGHPNTVVVYHQAESVQALRDFVATPELRTAMKNGGVKGAPKIELFQGTGGITRY